MKLISKISLLLALSPIAMAQNIEVAHDANYSINNDMQVGNNGLHPLEIELLNKESNEKSVANYWVFLAASGANSYRSTQTYTYKGGGCINGEGNGGTAYMDLALQIPDGHNISFMRFYYKDSTNTNVVSAYLQKADGVGGSATIQTLISDTDTGFSSVGTAMAHVVNNTTGAYYLRFEAKDDVNISACSVRLVVQPN